MSDTQASTPHQPAYRRYTESVDKGILHAIAALEIDGKFDLINPDVGGPLSSVRSEDLLAAAEYLRYLRKSKPQGAS